MYGHHDDQPLGEVPNTQTHILPKIQAEGIPH